MPYVKIIGNKFHRSKNKQKVLLLQSYGRTDGTAAGVTGLCTPIPAPGSKAPDPRPPVEGTPISFKLGKNGSFCRWRMLFPGLEHGSYLVEVFAVDGSSVPLAKDQNSVVAPGSIVIALQITDPANNEDISYEKNDFVAQGDTTTKVTSAILTPPSGNGNDMQALDIFCDPTGFQYWSASFDTLSEIGTYRLTVTDGVVIQTAVNLSVN